MSRKTSQEQQAKIRFHHGLDEHKKVLNPTEFKGAFRKDKDGLGYTLEYAIPWKLLNCAERPPQAGETHAALWMVHWSDENGRTCRGQLVVKT